MREDLDWGESPGAQIDLPRVLEFLRRRWRGMALTVAATLPLALIYPFLQVPVYEATATVALQRTPEVMDFGADFMPSERGRHAGFSREIRIASSNRVLGRVVDQMPPIQAKPPALSERIRSRIEAHLVRLGLRAPSEPASSERLRQQRIDRLRHAVTLEAAGGGALLDISARSREPAGAAWLANAIAQAFVEYEQDERQAASHAAITWLTEKTAELRGQIRRKEDAAASLLRRMGRVPQARNPVTEDAKTQLSTELQATRLEVLAVEQRLGQLRPRVLAGAGVGSDAERAELRSRLEDAKVALADARLRYTETHPEVQRLRAVVHDLGLRLGTGTEDVQDSAAADELREFRALEAERGRLRARASAIKKALDDLVESDVENTEVVAEYERIERELGVERQLLEVLLQRRNQTIMTAANKAAPARTLDYAVTPLKPASAGRSRTLVLGLGLVIALALGVGLARELLDQTAYDPEAVADVLGVPLLATIPTVSDGSAPERQTALESSTVVAECYRSLRTALLQSAGHTQLRSLLVTSAVAGEGKTTTSVNLAAGFGLMGRRVLLVDCDLRRPRLDKILMLAREPGLAELLTDGFKPEEIVQRPKEFDFDVVTSGRLPQSPVDLLGSSKFDLVFSRLAASYDIVVLDAPTLLAVSDALLLAARADGVLLVSKPGSVDRKAFPRIKHELHRAGAKLLGVTFTQVDAADPYAYPSYLRSPYVEGTRPGRRGKQTRPARFSRRKSGTG